MQDWIATFKKNFKSNYNKKYLVSEVTLWKGLQVLLVAKAISWQPDKIFRIYSEICGFHLTMFVMTSLKIEFDRNSEEYGTFTSYYDIAVFYFLYLFCLNLATRFLPNSNNSINLTVYMYLQFCILWFCRMIEIL